MQALEEKYCIIREYKNELTIKELLKKIVRIHIVNDMVSQKEKGCSNHEVENEKK